MSDVLLMDSSVWIATVDREDRFEEAARELIVESAIVCAALDLTLLEIANVVGARWRQADRAKMLCRSVLGRCAQPPVRVDLDLIEVIVQIAIRYGITAYDAAYVAVAQRYGWTLVSADIRDLVSKGLAVTPDAAV